MGRNKEKTVDEYVADNIRKLTDLGLYDPNFDRIILTFSEAEFQYDKYWRKLRSQRYRAIVETNGGPRKDPLITILENLRKDINALATSLGLTPKALKGLRESQPQTKSEFDKAMEAIFKNDG